MARPSSKKPERWLRIARERIDILFEQAEEASPKRADRYIFLARKLAMRSNIRLHPKLKRKFCHRCYHYFGQGGEMTVRTNPKTKAVEYTCKKCGGITRYGYRKEKV